MYRASVPVQRCTLPLHIPLLPLWTEQHVQSFSACTTVHFTFTYTSNPPMGRTSYTVPQCLQRCTIPLPIPLLPPFTVRPVRNLSACTTVHCNFTYTSNPPIYRTACIEPQCLYNGALYLYLYLYSPYGTYIKYRTSVPVHRCTLPLPIPLIPL